MSANTTTIYNNETTHTIKMPQALYSRAILFHIMKTFREHFNQGEITMLKHPLILYNREHTIERLTPRYGFGEAGHEG
jgi:hypothetical protein